MEGLKYLKECPPNVETEQGILNAVCLSAFNRMQSDRFLSGHIVFHNLSLGSNRKQKQFQRIIKEVSNMKIAVRYYTKTGNTKRLAEAVAEAVGAEALPISTPITEPVDILFLGNSYYAFSIDPEVRDFVKGLDKNMVGKIVNFGSAAMLNSTYKKVKAEADKVGIPMDEREFHCKGEFKGIHKGKPDESDLKAAAEFARKIVE